MAGPSGRLPSAGFLSTGATLSATKRRRCCKSLLYNTCGARLFGLQPRGCGFDPRRLHSPSLSMMSGEHCPRFWSLGAGSHSERRLATDVGACDLTSIRTSPHAPPGASASLSRHAFDARAEATANLRRANRAPSARRATGRRREQAPPARPAEPAGVARAVALGQGLTPKCVIDLWPLGILPFLGSTCRGRLPVIDSQRGKRLAEFVAWVGANIRGDEKGEAQVFLDRLFQGFGHAGVKEAGATLEDRIKKEGGKGTHFADLVWKPVVLIEMKKRGEDPTRHYRQAFDYWTRLVPGSSDGECQASRKRLFLVPIVLRIFSYISIRLIQIKHARGSRFPRSAR
jgi:hypothetical protein